MILRTQLSPAVRRLPVIVILLLAIAASRILRLHGMEMNIDEVWSIWQTFGTPRQILSWVPYDWPPLYYLVLGGWKELAGINPVVLRYFSVLVGLLGAASMYRLGLRMFAHGAALLITAVYAALGYAIFLSLVVRGYVVVYALFPFVMLLALRYFDRPTAARGGAVGVGLAVMFYTYFTSPVAFVVLGLYTLVMVRRAIWRWWLPVSVAFVLALPGIAAKLALVQSRSVATRTIKAPAFIPALKDLLVTTYMGNASTLWVGLFVLATALAISARRRLDRAQALFLLAWPALGAVILYLLNPVLGFFGPNYAWWIMIGLALWIGLGLSLLPERAHGFVLLLLVGVMFLPLPVTRYHRGVPRTPLIANFEWLRDHLMPDDVLILDPNLDVPWEAWDYFERVYFPDGLPYVSDPGTHSRVWYVTFDTQEDPQLKAAVGQGRVASIFVGPPGLLIRLYEGPPDFEGVLYDNGMRFHGAEVIQHGVLSQGPIVRREGQTVRLRLWWSADAAPLAADYSLSTAVVGGTGAIVAQFDGPPQVAGTPDDPRETSRWQPGRYYVEERTVTLPKTMDVGTHVLDLDLIVYQWWDNVRIQSPATDADGRLKLGTVYVKVW